MYTNILLFVNTHLTESESCNNFGTTLTKITEVLKSIILQLHQVFWQYEILFSIMEDLGFEYVDCRAHGARISA